MAASGTSTTDMILGLMRIKNEARWIERCVRSILPLCGRVIIMDDHSSDGTPDICAALPDVDVLHSPFETANEGRDKNWLLEQSASLHPEWIVFIDGDEMLAPHVTEEVRGFMGRPDLSCLSLRVLYLWNDEHTVRMDGVYGDFHRESIFRPNGSRYADRSPGANFHCGNVPLGARYKRKVLSAPLLHFGYMHREDRLRKFEWYNQQDPGNSAEDGYRHMVVGDMYPADSRFVHGGPLKLEALT